jgi:ABC-2 type transport system ATP-binding protein
LRRRLDLAASMVTRPPVLFLDEPTTGLDPTSRVLMWDVIRQLVGDGATLLLTTQYLDEADTLADQIVVIDHGRVIAHGTPHELKESTGGARLAITLAVPDPAAVVALRPLVEGVVHVSEDGRRLHAAVRNAPGLGTEAVRALDRAGILVDDVAVLQPSLDDVFFDLTGHPSATLVDPDPEAIPA